MREPDSSLQLRGLRADDRAPLEAVLRSDATFRPDEIAVALELIDGSIKGDPDYRCLVVAELATATALGYICYGRTPMTRATYDLYWIVVGAAARGRGAARRLIDEMERVALIDATERGEPGANIRVETSPADGHGAARAMYEKLGYPVASELADFYARGESLITYYKRLSVN